MKIKTSLLSMIIGSAISMNATAAPGNVGTINFIGSITDTTCDFVGEQDGVQGNTIDLGTYTVAEVNADGTGVKDFALVGRKGGTICEIGDAGSVDISWVPAAGAWNAAGLVNTGTANGAAVKLMDKTGNVFNALNDTVNYVKADAADGKLPFKAQMVSIAGAATAGTVISAAKFSVAYK
ncbi:fimbrial protein [Photobacterium leiognathi]|uniref:fimbrial protein n=1 Tax=Photobacterium leiognathi TaxID=553611 RepID=UPI002980D30E|nr:fimbrial protein [Photobacterium leiognathi]